MIKLHLTLLITSLIRAERRLSRNMENYNELGTNAISRRNRFIRNNQKITIELEADQHHLIN